MLGRRVRHAERQILTPLFSAPQNLSRLKTDEKENKKMENKKKEITIECHMQLQIHSHFIFFTDVLVIPTLHCIEIDWQVLC